MFEKAIARVEALLKGMVFDCHACGQCVLRKTGLICPMACPKGLRNGPCGGTLRGECEVYPDKPCVWVRIHHRTGKDSLALPALLPSPDARLYNTSSYLNFLAGHDEMARRPLPYLALGARRTRLPVQTPSRLEQRLKAGAFVKTCEIRAPRGADFESFRQQAVLVREHFDAVNATSYLNARPSLPSPVAAAKLVELGIEAICQSTCRDHTKTTFVAELLQNQMNGVHNVLCLTGDSYAGVPKIKQVFDMDGALMVYEARHLRETGVVHFTGEKLGRPPKLFLGAAINPFTEPPNVPVRRLKQKVAAGVDFIQTQLIFDVARFRQFMDLVFQERLHEEVFILAGVPVVTSAGGLAVLPRIPGVHLPAAIQRRLAGAKDLEKEGMNLAKELAEELSRVPGVAGVHLMLFGPDHAVLPPIVARLQGKRECWTEAELCASSKG
jgi:methylenetetrahydrofolate reductase (NADPH)